MQNHELTQEELNGLIDYFTDGEELYMPHMVTKDAYQEVLDRISSKEGSYLQSAYSTSVSYTHLDVYQRQAHAPRRGYHRPIYRVVSKCALRE